MSATPISDSTKASTRHATPNSPRLYLAFELGWSHWKLGFARGLGHVGMNALNPASLVS